MSSPDPAGDRRSPATRRSMRRSGRRRAAVVTAGAVGLAAGGMLATSGVLAGGASAASASGRITGLAGKCIGAARGSLTDGTAVDLYGCNGSRTQEWTLPGDGTIRTGGKCLDVRAAGTANGTAVQVYTCNGTAAQQWTFTGGQLVNPHANKCLDLKDNSSADYTVTQLWTCTGGTNQRWTVPGTVSGPTSPSPSTGVPSPTPSPSSSPTSSTPSGGNPAMAAAPYAYLGWGNLPDPTVVMDATGVKWFTMAFVLDAGGCTPRWDGNRALTGGNDASVIARIRGKGGDVIPSFGGASGTKLEQSCSSASALAGAYQKVIDAYRLKAMDVDIEGDAYYNDTVQQRTVDALKIVRQQNPGITLYVTFPSNQSGPDSSLIERAAASGLTVDGWTIMPFDFGGAGANMGTLTTRAADGLKNAVKNAYGYTDDVAYRHSGISSMNGITDEKETVTVADFRTMLAYAKAHHLARFTFWSANRDRPCANGGGTGDDTCSGVSQSAWDFTRVVAGYTG